LKGEQTTLGIVYGCFWHLASPRESRFWLIFTHLHGFMIGFIDAMHMIIHDLHFPASLEAVLLG